MCIATRAYIHPSANLLPISDFRQDDFRAQFVALVEKPGFVGQRRLQLRRALDIQQMREDLKRAEELREELRRDIALCERLIKELGDQTVRKERGT